MSLDVATCLWRVKEEITQLRRRTAAAEVSRGHGAEGMGSGLGRRVQVGRGGCKMPFIIPQRNPTDREQAFPKGKIKVSSR